MSAATVIARCAVCRLWHTDRPATWLGRWDDGSLCPLCDGCKSAGAGRAMGAPVRIESGATLIHREVNPDRSIVTHVYSNGDVWQISRDDSGTFASRITNGYVMRWFPNARMVALFGEPDDWQHATDCARHIVGNHVPCDCH